MAFLLFPIYQTSTANSPKHGTSSFFVLGQATPYSSRRPVGIKLSAKMNRQVPAEQSQQLWKAVTL
jgi:hypothetical protein